MSNTAQSDIRLGVWDTYPSRTADRTRPLLFINKSQARNWFWRAMTQTPAIAGKLLLGALKSRQF